MDRSAALISIIKSGNHVGLDGDPCLTYFVLKVCSGTTNHFKRA